MHHHQVIFIIGFMGVGKTTLGKKLANKLQLNFIDLDQTIEQLTQQTITEIFSLKGEAYFRQLERKTLEDILSNNKPKIISVGGGFPCFFNNMQLLNDSGTTLYFRRPVKELFKRLKNGKQHRPLLQNLEDEELLEFIEETMEKRAPFYEQAHFTFDRDEQTIEFIVNKLQKL